MLGRKISWFAAAARYPDFKAGYDMGVEGFCTYENGLRAGEAGGKLSPACSGLPHFAEGYARYELVTAISRVEDQLAATEEKIVKKAAIH